MLKMITNRPERLLSLGLFKGLEVAALRRLADGATVVPAPCGTTIYREGAVCTGLHFVVSGQVKLSLQNGSGQEKVVQLAGEQESFGEAALFLGERYCLTAEALVDTTVLHVAREAVLAEAERSAVFSGRIIRELSRQVRQRTFDLQCCLLLNGTQRVTRFLLDQLPDGVNGSTAEVALPAKKGIIASRLNLTHEHFSRILHDLMSLALIEVDGRTIRIPNVGKLRVHSAG